MLWLQKVLEEARALSQEQIDEEAKGWPLPPGKLTIIGTIEDPLLRALITLNIKKVKAFEQKLNAFSFQANLTMGLSISDDEKAEKMHHIVTQKIALVKEGQEELQILSNLVQFELDHLFPKLPEGSNGVTLGDNWHVYSVEPPEGMQGSVLAIVMRRGSDEKEEEKPRKLH